MDDGKNFILVILLSGLVLLLWQYFFGVRPIEKPPPPGEEQSQARPGRPEHRQEPRAATPSPVAPLAQPPGVYLHLPDPAARQIPGSELWP
jgi:hypothetical protein